jgi:hypothetical protein
MRRHVQRIVHGCPRGLIGRKGAVGYCLDPRASNQERIAAWDRKNQPRA